MTISIVQMDLVCEKNGYIEASQSMFMAGCLIGCLLFGGISDRYTPKTLVDGVNFFQNCGNGYMMLTICGNQPLLLEAYLI